MSTFIEQLGQSQYFLTFDEEYRERLFAVQGEIGRSYEFTVLDKNRMPVTDPNVFLNFIIQTKTGNTVAVKSTNNNGKYKIILPQRVLYFSGYATYQLTLEEKTGTESDFRLLGAKQATIYIEPNINFTAPDGENFIFSFEEFKQKMELLDAILDGQNTVLQEQIEARDEMLEIYNNIDLATNVISKIEEAEILKNLVEDMYNNSTVADLNRKIDDNTSDISSLNVYTGELGTRLSLAEDAITELQEGSNIVTLYKTVTSKYFTLTPDYPVAFDSHQAELSTYNGYKPGMLPSHVVGARIIAIDDSGGSGIYSTQGQAHALKVKGDELQVQVVFTEPGYINSSSGGSHSLSVDYYLVLDVINMS